MLTDEQVIEMLDLTTYVHPITNARYGHDVLYYLGNDEELIAKVRKIAERGKS